MKKSLLACAAATAMVAGTLTIPTSADAGCRGACPWIVGGAAAIVGGAIVGNAIAGGPPPGYAYRGYAPAQGYVSYNDYYGPQPVGCPGGYWGRRPIYDRWGNQVGWSRPKFFCPY